MTRVLLDAAAFVRRESYSALFNHKILLKVLERAGRVDLAEESTKQFAAARGEPQAYALLGDVLLAQGKFDAALECYLLVAKFDQTDATLMWRAGHAASKAGKSEGAALTARARQMVLGDEDTREILIRIMRQFGQNDEANDEERRHTRLGSLSQYRVNRADYLSKKLEHDDYATPLPGTVKFMQELYHRDYIDNNLAAAAFRHQTAAMKALGESDFQRVDAEAFAAQSFAPPDTEFLGKVLSGLRAAKQNEVAEKVLNGAIDRVAPVVADYPNFKPAAEVMAALKKLEAK